MVNDSLGGVVTHHATTERMHGEKTFSERARPDRVGNKAPAEAASQLRQPSIDVAEERLGPDTGPHDAHAVQSVDKAQPARGRAGGDAVAGHHEEELRSRHRA